MNLNRFLPQDPLSMLEGIFMAEYLIFRGYLVADLDQLPPRVAKNLMMEAYRFAQRRLADLETATKPFWEIESYFSPN